VFFAWIDMYSIKPIETDYDGYAFRSRTEARYALMWRTLFWPYEFEKQSFVLECGPFVPDFWLPGRGWFEVKGPPPTKYHEELCRCLAVETQEVVALGQGQPGLDTILICFHPNGERLMTTLVWYLTQRSSWENAAEAIKAARTKRFYRDPPEKNVVPLRLVESKRLESTSPLGSPLNAGASPNV
jgi:hypothetical protein